jgi:hypothetical protein
LHNRSHAFVDDGQKIDILNALKAITNIKHDTVFLKDFQKYIKKYNSGCENTFDPKYY